MSTVQDLRSYRFRRAEQWGKGVLDGLEWVGGHLQPSPQYGPVTRAISVAGGVERLWWHGRKLMWLTGDGWIEWIDDCADAPCRIEAPQAVSDSTRVVAGRRWLWAISRGRAVISRFDADTFAEAPSVSFASGLVRDATGDGRGGLFVLSGRDGQDAAPSSDVAVSDTPLADAQQPDAVVHVRADGSIGKRIDLGADVSGAVSFTYLRQAHRFALLFDDTRTLVYLDLEDTTARSAGRATIDTFEPQRIAGDGQGRVAVSGRVDTNSAAAATWALFDEFGTGLAALTSADLPRPYRTAAFADIAERMDSIAVATRSGILVFEPAESGPSRVATGRYLTPALFSPPTTDLRGWLRADLLATIPAGAGVTLTALHTGDPAAVTEVSSILADPTKTPAARIKAVIDRLDNDPTALVRVSYPLPGTEATDENTATPQHYDIPLFTISDPWVWLLIDVHGAPGMALPQFSELRVLYPDVSLQQYVPAIFRGDTPRRQQTVANPAGTPATGDPNGFFRQLLGVLETSTQDLDETIAALGRRIHPRWAEGVWLDFVARWMDLPWDDILPDAIKRAIVTNAATLLASRGTRAGLLALLAALFPSARISILDANADLRLARLAGPKVQGTCLPAILPGLKANASVMSRRAILNVARLPCPDQPDDTGRFLGALRIDIGATAQQRRTLQDLLPSLLSTMVPAGLRIIIRWRPASPEAPPGSEEPLLRLADPGPGHLGGDAVLGRLTLAGRDESLVAEAGLMPGFRLH